MICFHKYEKIIEQIIEVVHSSIFKSLNGRGDAALLKVFRCKKCGKIKGYKLLNDRKYKLDEIEIYKIKEKLNEK